MKTTVEELEALEPDSYVHQVRPEVGRILKLLLADEYRLYQITRDYHWNVTGPDYHTLRLQFQLQHEQAAGWVDNVSEWVRALRVDSAVLWAELIGSARCSAAPGIGLSAQRMLAELLRLHEEMITQLYTDSDICLHYLGNASTAALLAGLKERHENAAWMLRAQLGATWDRNQADPISA